MESILEIGNKAAKHADELGADEAEIFLYKESLVSVKFVGGIFASRSGAIKGIKGTLVRIAEPWMKKKGLPFVNSGVKAGVGIRAIVNKAIGFASVSSIEEKRVLEAVENAIKIAKVRPPDPNWNSLPEAKKSKGQIGIFDERISGMDVDKALQFSVDCCVTAGDFDKRITQAMAMLSTSATEFAVVNTHGIEVKDRGTTFTAGVGCKAKSDTEEVSSGDSVMSRSFVENLQEIALNASKRTIECFGRKPLREKYVGPVLFENGSWNELFSMIFTAGVSALNIQESRSIYAKKIGKQVASENIHVVDDGTLHDGYGTSIMDHEGTPKQKTPIIENGVLENFLYDNYAAKRENLESTGNASRYKPPTATYANQPIIRPTNLLIEPRKGKLDDLMKEVMNGVLIKGSLIGVHTSNMVTGDFSVTAENAFKIENGAIAHPLKACTVAGNLYEALQSVTAIGNDPKCFGYVTCPSIAVEKIVVAT